MSSGAGPANLDRNTVIFIREGENGIEGRISKDPRQHLILLQSENGPIHVSVDATGFIDSMDTSIKMLFLKNVRCSRRFRSTLLERKGEWVTYSEETSREAVSTQIFAATTSKEQE